LIYKVFFAVKDAIRAARKQNIGKDAYFEMRMPSSSERIRMYCADAIARRAIASMATCGDIATSPLEFQPQGTY
jgi:hypothetical protein